MPREAAEAAAGLTKRLTEASVEAQSSKIDRPELVAVILLSLTAILTAWTGFQASKWGGATSIAFNEASAQRIDASRQEATANRAETIQVGLFTQWLQAASNGDQHSMDFLSERFPEPLKSAFAAWQGTNPSTDSQAPSSPFAMAEYQIPGFAAAANADAEADAKFTEAVANNHRSDNYVLLTVAFASVLFFAAMSGRMKSPRSQWTLLGIAVALCITTSMFLILFPKRL